MEKILKTFVPICLYCGNEKELKYEEYTAYHECNCEDAIKEREIREKIRQLEMQLPRQKFVINNEPVLRKAK